MSSLHRGVGRPRWWRSRRDAVVTPGSHRLPISDRDAGKAADRDGLFVGGEQVCRGNADDAAHPVQSGEHARRGPITQRDHDPESAPDQPGDEEGDLTSVDDRAVPEVVLQPQSGFDDPGSSAPMFCPSRHWAFDFGEGSAGGAVGTGVAEPQEPLVGFVAADLAVRLGHPPVVTACHSSTIYGKA